LADVVYYNTWKYHGDTSEAGIYGRGGENCIAKCDADSSCLGFQSQSSMRSQCYLFTTAPGGLGEAMSMDAAKSKKSTWSVYMKNAYYVAPSPSPPRAAPPSPGVGLEASKYVVYYDSWKFSGDTSKQYAAGTACFTKCDADSSCLGLQLLSNQRSQCYMLGSIPHGLGGGMSIDEAKSKAGKWSVFMKNEHYSREEHCKTLTDTHPIGACNSWKDKYCSWHGWVQTVCAKTCAGCPATEHSHSSFVAGRALQLEPLKGSKPPVAPDPDTLSGHRWTTPSTPLRPVPTTA
jgi:hypothetical protein